MNSALERANVPRTFIVSASAHSVPHLLYTVSPASGHDKPDHPESVSRVAAIQQGLQQHGLDDRHPHVSVLQLSAPLAPASKELMQALQLVHPDGYLQRLQEICCFLEYPAMIDDSTYIAPKSFSACCETAAAVLNVLDAVLVGQPGTVGFCLVRPPGHHVKITRPMGFGLINFMAVAAKHALQQPDVRKVMILDWDVHHGNGTEDIFYDSNSVLYISTHQQGLWPYTGKVTAVGAGQGEGYTINVPLPGDSGHSTMQAVWQQVIVPAAHRFGPDLILCSAGYDAHWADPLAGLQFESCTYHMMCQQTAQLARDLCGGRCMFILEGGYHTRSLAVAVANSFAGILHEPDLGLEEAALLREEPLGKVEAVLRQVAAIHSL